MVFFVALAIFLALAAVVWIVALALFNTYCGGPDLRSDPHFVFLSGVAILLVGMVSFFPYWIGYLLSLGVWWLAARNFFMLPTRKALALFGILAVLSIVSRFVVLGVLHMIG